MVQLGLNYYYYCYYYYFIVITNIIAVVVIICLFMKMQLPVNFNMVTLFTDPLSQF